MAVNMALLKITCLQNKELQSSLMIGHFPSHVPQHLPPFRGLPLSVEQHRECHWRIRCELVNTRLVQPFGIYHRAGIIGVQCPSIQFYTVTMKRFRPVETVIKRLSKQEVVNVKRADS